MCPLNVHAPAKGCLAHAPAGAIGLPIGLGSMCLVWEVMRRLPPDVHQSRSLDQVLFPPVRPRETIDGASQQQFSDARAAVLWLWRNS